MEESAMENTDEDEFPPTAERKSGKKGKGKGKEKKRLERIFRQMDAKVAAPQARIPRGKSPTGLARHVLAEIVASS
jgi:hypothetical protein